MPDQPHIREFEEARPRLLGIAYRILGSRADAEDAVQDTFLKWLNADREAIEQPVSWLTTTCTRRCLDLLRAAHRSRVSYVGSWLPEPIHTAVGNEADERLELASSLTTAFLLMLERLTPKERAAYLLHDIFEVSYAEIAEMLEMQEAACRKLVSRAKANVDQDKVRHSTPRDQQEQLLDAFRDAIDSGATAQLTALLSDEIRLSSDGGGKVPTIIEVLKGRDEVLGFVIDRLRGFWADYRWIDADINGGPGIILTKNGEVEAAVSFAYDEKGRAEHIYVMRNPDKLARLDPVSIH